MLCTFAFTWEQLHYSAERDWSCARGVYTDGKFSLATSANNAKTKRIARRKRSAFLKGRA